MGDVPNALNSGCVWMNKFDLNIDAQAVVCIREYLVRWFLLPTYLEGEQKKVDKPKTYLIVKNPQF